MKPKTTLLSLLFVAVTFSLMVPHAHAQTIISQTANGVNASSGAGNYGQSFEVDSSLLDTSLSSISFTKGNGGGGAATTFIDVYSIGTANFGTLDFGSGTETANLNFLGSSSNSLDTTVADGTSLIWNFAGIDLSGHTDEALFLVFSNSSGASSSGFIGVSLRVEGSVGNQVFTNTNASESHTVAYGGIPSTSFVNDVDNTYSATLVPEPSSFALMMLGLGGLWLLRRRT
jgi:hypothetical protein